MRVRRTRVLRTIGIVAIAFQTLNDSGVRIETGLAQFVQILNHVKVVLQFEFKSIRDVKRNSIQDVTKLLTRSTCACDACPRVSMTTVKYFWNSTPMASATSPNTDKICGFTLRCTFSF